MTFAQFQCEEGKRINVRIITDGEKLVVDPGQTRANYPYIVVGDHKRLEDDPPYEKRVKVVRCGEEYAEVRIIGDSLRKIFDQ
jgi:hypothetical protein